MHLYIIDKFAIICTTGKLFIQYCFYSTSLIHLCYLFVTWIYKVASGAHTYSLWATLAKTYFLKLVKTYRKVLCNFWKTFILFRAALFHRRHMRPFYRRYVVVSTLKLRPTSTGLKESQCTCIFRFKKTKFLQILNSLDDSCESFPTITFQLTFSCSKSAIETLEKVVIDVTLWFLLLTLNIFHSFFKCFCCWL